MTKSQAFYYLSAVLVITLIAYVYTTIVHAPSGTDETVIEENVTLEENTPVTQENAEVTESPAQDVQSLANTSWKWEYTETTDKGPAIKPKSPAFILSFDSEGRMSSQTDCNTLGGDYQTSGDKLSFGAMMSTRMFCADSDETVYGTQLSQVETFTMTTSTLELQLASGAGTMYFSAVAE